MLQSTIVPPGGNPSYTLRHTLTGASGQVTFDLQDQTINNTTYTAMAVRYRTGADPEVIIGSLSDGVVSFMGSFTSGDMLVGWVSQGLYAGTES